MHNAGGSSRFFDPQISTLEKLGRVIAVDLPGHGESEWEVEPSVKNYAKALAALCKKLKLSNIYGIGLNYGANILLELASMFDLVVNIIMIDPPIFISADIESLIKDNIKSLEKQTPKEHAKALIIKSFKNPTMENTKLATEVFEKVQTKLLSALYKDLLVWDKTSKLLLAKIPIPITCILTDSSLCDIAALKTNLNSPYAKIKIFGL